MSEVSLTVRGKQFTGWKVAYVSKSLLQVAGTFGFSATNTFAYKPKSWNLRLGDSCKVKIGDQLMITGSIEDMPISYDKETHTIQVAGRDATGDLVDCSHVDLPNEYLGQTVAEIIVSLCDPFGISVVIDDTAAEAAAANVEDFEYDQGTVFEEISKLCRKKAILPVSYGDGKLTLTRVGSSHTKDSLTLGVNIKAGVLDQSDRDRYSYYIVKGQGKDAPYSDWEDDVMKDKDIYRPLIILAENEDSIAECRDRAEWESRVRAGQSRKIQYEVQGWTQSNGVVWPLNSLVRVKDVFFGIDDTMLISDLQFNINNESGTTTKIGLVFPETFELRVEPVKEIKTKYDWRAALTIQEE